MAKKTYRLKTKVVKPLLIFTFLTVIFFAPFLLNPNILTNKDNDLGRNYVPAFLFIKESFGSHQSLPLWNPNQLMGEPFLSNPTYSLLYPLNFIFLIFPVNFGSILYYCLHFLIAATSTYFLAQSFGYTKISSTAAAIFYTFSTKMLVHVSAGHITMIAAFSYFPLVFLSIKRILESGQVFKWIVLCAAGLTLMTLTYPTVFYYTFLFLIFYLIYKMYVIVTGKRTKVPLLSVNLGISFALIVFLWFGMSAISLLAQLEFGPLSTRTQLTLEDVAIPVWNFKRFSESLIWPYRAFNEIDHESFLYFGIVPLTLSFITFWQLNQKQKVVLALVGFFTLLFILGLSTPIFEIAYKTLPYLKYSRVTTRIWFIVALLIALFAGKALERLKSKTLVYVLVTLFLLESSLIGYKKIFSTKNLSFKNEYMYQFIAQDESVFRVYCTTYCFNPQLLKKYKIQIFNGESPVQSKSYVNFAKSAGNYNFSNFAVIFPPYQVWQTDNPPLPNASILGDANVKYVVSTYPIDNQNFEFLQQFNDFIVYRNQQYRPRAYFKADDVQVKIIDSSPNNIELSFNPKNEYRTLFLSHLYYPGWYAYQNKLKYEILKRDPIFTKVTIFPGTDSIQLKYQPGSFEVGKVITVSTLLTLLLLMIKIRTRWRK